MVSKFPRIRALVSSILALGCYIRVARFFLVPTTYEKLGKYTKLPKIHQLDITMPHDRKVLHIAANYTNILHSKALQNIPNLELLECK
jgi:hypothetical protein